MSLVHMRPIEMHKPKKIAILIFAERGWIGKYRHIRPPLPHGTRRNFYTVLNRTFATSGGALADFMAMGAIRRSSVRGCELGTYYELTDSGKEILAQCPTELLAEARAMVRATLWKQIVLNRHERARDELFRARFSVVAGGRL